MKLWDIVVTANANLLRNKVRTILTIVAVFIGAFTITLTAGVNAGVNGYINKELGTLGGNNLLLAQAKGTVISTSGPQKYNPDQSSSSTRGISIPTLTDADIAKIRTAPNVTKVSPQYSVAVTYAQGPSSTKYKLMVNQMEDGINVDLAKGVAPDNNSNQNQITLLTGYGKAFGFSSDAAAIGQTLTLATTTPLGQIQTVTAKIVGVQNDSLLSSGGSMINNALIGQLYDITTAGMPAKVKNQYFAAAVTVTPGLSDAQLNTTKDAIQNMGYKALTVKDEIGTIATIINAITIALIGFGAIALIAASFGVVNTLFMAVQERTKEIGLMKAMGMSRRKVFLLFSVEAILLGFWGSVLGAAAAFGVGTLISNAASQSFLKDLHGFTLLEFPVTYVVVIVVVIMLITFLSGTLPARRAAKQNPIDALRYE